MINCALLLFFIFAVNGVPGFWLHALSKNNLLTREVIVSAECFSTLLVIQITALINCFPSYLFNQIIGRDTEALAYLRDIKGSKIDGDNKGFKLDFYFEPNNFFMNPVLTKTYHMVDEGVPILAKAIG